MIGLKPSEFWDILPREFFLMQKAYYKKEQQKTQESWEQTRWIAAVLLQPHMKKGKRMKPTELVKFPWEENKNKKQTKKEIQHEIDYTLELYKKINDGQKKD
tara:strand:- start:1320 stop:1625 length:306 start_codon:yes stop_codon:yes gene_type:complete